MTQPGRDNLERDGHDGRAARPPSARADDETATRLRVARLEAELHALREENARAHQILRSAVDYAIITLDPQGCITAWSHGAELILGYAEAEVLGRSGDIVFTAEDRGQGCFALELRRAIELGRAVNERWHIRRDGTRFWASGLMMPLLDANDQPNGFLNILRDRSEMQTQAERRELLMAEMNHRVKNTFAMVQAVAAQSGRHASTMEAFQTAFFNRLQALARSHDMLIRGAWEDAPLRSVVEGAVATYCGGEPGRVTIDGPAVLLAANLVVASTLTFHELSTNAAKHGALSVPGGTVDVSWQVKPSPKGQRQVELLWRERGGPPVREPAHRGFGTQLLSRGLGHSASSARLDFQPTGLQCHLSFPLGSGG